MLRKIRQQEVIYLPYGQGWQSERDGMRAKNYNLTRDTLHDKCEVSEPSA